LKHRREILTFSKFFKQRIEKYQRNKLL
jgi:hypothetical protein